MHAEPSDPSVGLSPNKGEPKRTMAAPRGSKGGASIFDSERMRSSAQRCASAGRLQEVQQLCSSAALQLLFAGPAPSPSAIRRELKIRLLPASRIFSPKRQNAAAAKPRSASAVGPAGSHWRHACNTAVTGCSARADHGPIQSSSACLRGVSCQSCAWLEGGRRHRRA